MMSPNKRRMIVLDTSDEDEDSFKHRRSSLRVNLSYCTNLSDSGNGSLGKTEAENDERGMDRTQINRRLLSSKHRSNASNQVLSTADRSKCAENDDSEVSPKIKKGIQLKRLTINLEDISAKKQTLDANCKRSRDATFSEAKEVFDKPDELSDISAKEQALDTSCKRLKDAILSKTKEMFDKQDEFSVKTAMVLANQENSITNINNLNADKSADQHFENIRSTICYQYTDIVNNQQKEDEPPDIDSTPKHIEERRNSEKVVNRSKLTPKRLFAEEDGREGCKIIEDVILSRPRFSLAPLKQIDQSSSPILSGSNRKLQLLRSRSKASLQNQSAIRSSTHSTAYSDHSINMGQPLTCSTFIEDNAKDERKTNSYDKASQQGSTNVSRPVQTINTLVSMELTEIHSGPSRMKSVPSKNSRNSIINTEKQKSVDKSVEQNKSISMSAQKFENIDSPFNKLTLQDSSKHRRHHSHIANNANVTGACINATVTFAQPVSIETTLATKTHDVSQAQEKNNQIKKLSKRQDILNLSDSNSIRSSLNVNTSLDVATESSKEKNVRRSNDCEIIVTDRCPEITNNNEKPIVTNNQRESTITNRTSLQVNTSVDSVCKTWREKNNCSNEQSPIESENNKYPDRSIVDNRNSSAAEDTEANDVDSLENISLIERLRNISTRVQVSHNNKLEISETGNKERTRDAGSNGATSAKSQSGNCASNNSRSSHSYVEGTPYPISRSILFKRQLRHKIQNSGNSTTSCSDDSNSVNNEENDGRAKSNDLNPISVSSKAQVSTGVSKKTEDDTVILEDTLNCNPFINQEKTTVIEDTPGKIESEVNEENTAALQNAENITTRRGKRRLLPLNDNSQLCSFEPHERHSDDTSDKSTSVERNKKKKLRKKRPKKKPTDSKNDAKNNIANEQVFIDDDCDIFESKRKENKKTRKPKKIVSKKIVIKKFVNENMLRMTEESKRIRGNQSMENRNSSNDFVAHRTIPSQWNRYKSQKIVIVTTGLSKGDKSLVKSIVKSLGMAEIELNVSRRTTHVVSTGVRTLNLLRGIIRGCWLITLEWVLKSLESNVWLNPEEFEMKHFSKAILENRKDRQLFGPSYVPELFTACGFIYVEHKTTLPCDTLKELIKTAGGHITENPKFARIIVGADGLKETWVIDSITTGELQSTKLYQKK